MLTIVIYVCTAGIHIIEYLRMINNINIINLIIILIYLFSKHLR